MGRVITIASGKGGVGKTTMTANLGVALTKQGKKTVLVDLDMGLRNIDVILGMENLVLDHLGDYFEGSSDWQDVLIRDERYPDLALLAAAQNLDPSLITEESFLGLIRELKAAFDLILIDAPAGIGPMFQLAAAAADEGIVVTQPTVPAVRDADKVLHLMEEAGISRRFILVNELRLSLTRKKITMTPQDISEVLGSDLVGVVPEDIQVILASNEGKSLVGTASAAGKAIERIAGRLCGRNVPLPAFTRRRGGLFHA
ncbi:MAG: septum site-determining protein MinD [Lachnospiraceae bacterium]|nr:septum site-determining protein MinD [Lachnospiraceae bacterium]